MSKPRGFAALVGLTIASVDESAINQVTVTTTCGQVFEIEVPEAHHGIPVLALTQGGEIPDVIWCKGSVALRSGCMKCGRCKLQLAGKSFTEIGVTGRVPGSSGFTMAVFEAKDVPEGTKVFK